MIVIPNTEVRLLFSVPLNNNYEHQLTFNSKSEQSSFFYNKTAHAFTDFTYVKEDGTLKVPRGRNKLYNCNYIMFRNNEFTDKWFYAFITKLEYVNPDTTKVHFEIDAYQSWMFEINYHQSFVVREHTQRWNSDGSPVINTVDEGLNYGTDYETVLVQQHVPFDDVFFLVMVCTETMHGGSADKGLIKPVLNGSPQPLTYYIHPFRMNGTTPKTTWQGTEWTLSSLNDVLKGLYKQEGAVNNVAALYVTEFLGIDMSYDGTTIAFPSNFDPVTIQDGTSMFNTYYLKDLPNYGGKMKWLGSKYLGYANVTESKLLMYPYTVTLLTDLKGDTVEIKNEYIQDKDLILMTKGSMGVSNKVSYHVANYLMNESDMENAGEVAMEHALINNNPNDVPIVTDLLSAYLQGNRNSLATQTQQIALNSIMRTVGGGMSTIGSAVGRNPVGVAAGVGEMATAGVNSYFQLQGLMSKQKDLETVPPSLTKMGGNTAFDYGNGLKGVYIVKKQITAEYRKKLSGFFKMYGYKVNELKMPNFKTRQHWNYVQTVGMNLTGNIPADDIATLKNMFNNGVTLWHGDWIGNYDLGNGEL